MKGPTWIAIRLTYLLREHISEQISDSNVGIFGVIRDLNATAVTDPKEQEIFFLSDADIDYFLYTQLANQFTVDASRLANWVDEAYAFFQQNKDHPDFERLFAHTLHYEMAIFNCLRFDFSTTPLKSYIVETTKIKSLKMEDEYPIEVQSVVIASAKRAIEPALVNLAADLHRWQANSSRPKGVDHFLNVRKLRRDPSFTNKKGAIPFRVDNELLEIGRNNGSSRANQYRGLLDRAIRRISDRQVMARLHNKEPELRELFGEYEDVLHKHSRGVAVASLWIIGHDIDARLRANQSSPDPDDRIDGGTVAYLMTFLTSHNLYLQCFPVAEEIAEDLDRSSRIYMRLDERARTAPWILLQSMGRNSALVEVKSAALMSRAAEAITDPSKVRTKGIMGIGLGLLRGAFQAIGARFVEKMSGEIGDEAIDLTNDAVQTMIKDDRLLQTASTFMREHEKDIEETAQSLPVYFSWLRILLSFFSS